MKKIVKIYCLGFVVLTSLGIVSGSLTYRMAFPWGSIIAICSGLYCFFEGMKEVLRR